MKVMDKDRRKYQRIQIELKARVGSGKTVQISGSTRDLSLKGFFIRTPKMLPVGTVCRATLTVSQGGEKVDIKADGVVVRHEKAGFAVELKKIDLGSVSFIFWFFMLHRMLEDKKGGAL